MNKPWLKSYPPKIPFEIEPFRYTSLGDFMLGACQDNPTIPAFVSMGKSLSYADLEQKSQHLAAYLLSLGLQKGARVAIMMPNLLQYPVALMAILRAGLVVVNVNPLYTRRELAQQLSDSGADTIIILENFAHILEQALEETPIRKVIVASIGDLLGLKGIVVNFAVRHVKRMVQPWKLSQTIRFRAALRKGARLPFKPHAVGLDDLAFLQYTGGTTGIAKGAMLLHRNILANTMQSRLWFETAYLDRPRPAHVKMVCALPLYHVYALTVNALMGMVLGGTNLLIMNPRDIPAFVEELQGFRFNIFVGLNTIFNALLNNSKFQALDFSALDLTFGGGMAVQSSVAERWKKLTGKTIYVGYGLSETSPVVIANRFDLPDFTSAIGLPLPSTDVKICDDNGHSVPAGTAGELCVRGPQLMLGYWNQPEETQKAMTADGFLKTGDIAVMDQCGTIRLIDRKKDMILVSGFNVYPNEIEDVVSQHPGVQEVAAIGIPDENAGEVPKIFIVKKDPNLTKQDLIKFIRENLTGYKRPRQIEFRESLPKSNVGKILRRELR